MTASKPGERESAAPRADAPRVVHAPLPPISDRKKLAMLAGGALGAAVAGMLTRNDPGQRPPADPEERRQPQAGGRGTRSLTLSPDSYSADDHTVEAILSAGSPVARYYFTEELEISEDAIDLSRVSGRIGHERDHFGVADLLEQGLGHSLDLILADVGEGQGNRTQLRRPPAQQNAARGEVE